MSDISTADALKAALRNPRLLLKVAVPVILVEGALASLGIAIFMILHSAAFAVAELVFYWPPAFDLFARLFHLTNPPESIRPPPLKGRRIARFIFFLTFQLAMLAFALFWLIRGGFCSQNLTCMLRS